MIKLKTLCKENGCNYADVFTGRLSKEKYANLADIITEILYAEVCVYMADMEIGNKIPKIKKISLEDKATNIAIVKGISSISIHKYCKEVGIASSGAVRGAVEINKLRYISDTIFKEICKYILEDEEPAKEE